MKFYDSWTGSIIIVLLFIFTVAQAFVIPSGSMKHTLLVGDHLFVKKYAYGLPTPHLPFLEWQLLPDFFGNGHLITASGPERGDIVVFRYPKEPKIHYVKRCVAKAGDLVVYAHQKLFVRMSEGDAFMKERYEFCKDEKSRACLVSLTDAKGAKLFVREPYDMPGIYYDTGCQVLTQKQEKSFLFFKKSSTEIARDEKGQALCAMGVNGLPRRADETFASNLRYHYPDVKNHLGAKEYRFAMSPANYDELEQKMPGFDFGAFKYEVEEDSYFMMGDNRNHSFDSRFWGSVHYRFIQGEPWFAYLSWDKDYKPRWDRFFKSIKTLENDIDLIREEGDDEGIY